VSQKNEKSFSFWTVRMPALTYVYGASLAIGGIFAYQGQWKIGMSVHRSRVLFVVARARCQCSCCAVVLAHSMIAACRPVPAAATKQLCHHPRSSKAALGWGLLFGTLLCWSGLQVIRAPGASPACFLSTSPLACWPSAFSMLHHTSDCSNFTRHVLIRR